MAHYTAQQPEIVMCTLSRRLQGVKEDGGERRKATKRGWANTACGTRLLLALLPCYTPAALLPWRRSRGGGGGLASRVGCASRSPPSPAQHPCAACQAENSGPSQGKGGQAPAKVLAWRGYIVGSMAPTCVGGEGCGRRKYSEISPFRGTGGSVKF